MKRILLSVMSMLSVAFVALAQNIQLEMPKGFDSVREGIAAGKIDRVQYIFKNGRHYAQSADLYAARLFKKEKISCTVPVAWHWRR